MTPHFLKSQILILSSVWWKRNIEDEYGSQERSGDINKMFSRILWRTRKREVEAELNLPVQRYHSVKLHFSPVEAHFYTKLHQSCSTSMLPDSESESDNDENNEGLVSTKFMQPLLKLRQACCHPQGTRSSVQWKID